MKHILRVLLTLVVSCVGFTVAAGTADAATAAPWAYVQVQVTAHSIEESLFVPVTGYCPSGYLPISGGISGPGPFYLVNEYATYWNDSFSEQVETLVADATYVLTVECAAAPQVGTIQIVSADFARNSSDQAGGWVPCPTGTRVIGGGADWNLAGDRNVQYAAPSDDGASWYALGASSTGGNSLHVEAYCVPAGELAAAQRVTQAYTDPASGASLIAACPSDTRTLTGGVYAALAGAPVDPSRFAGYVQDSFPDQQRYAWHASVPSSLPAGTTVYVTAWCVPASIPTVVLTSEPPAVTAQTFAHFGFSASDPAGYPLTYTCTLDGTVAGCDSATGTGYVPVDSGAHLFSVSVANPDGERANATYQWTVDAIAPTVTTTALNPFTLASATTVSWTGSDNTGGTGIASYQVRERTAAYSAGFTPWSYPSTWQALSPATSSVTAAGLTQGVDYCFAVRATDKVGNTSAWSAPRCTARPLDDRALSAAAHWVRGSGSHYWNNTITTTSTAGDTASRTGAELDRVGIIATRGPGMGTVAVYIGSTLIGQINLATTATHYQSLILLPPISYRTGTVQVKVVSNGKPVQLDGLAVSRS